MKALEVLEGDKGFESWSEDGDLSQHEDEIADDVVR